MLREVLALRLSRRENARPASEVSDDAHIDETRRARKRCRFVKAGLVQLERAAAAGTQRLPAPFDLAAEHIEPISAPFEGKRGLEGRNLLGNFCHNGGGNVRRVGNNQVKLADCRLGNARRKVAFDDAHAVGKPERARVLARERNGVRRDVGSDDARVGTLIGYRASDTTTPRAQIGHEKRLGARITRGFHVLRREATRLLKRTCYLGKRIRAIA